MSLRRAELPVLGDLELAVLKLLWRTDEADVRELHRTLLATRKISLNTVGSALERLVRKKLLHRRKISRAYHYRPALSENEYRALRIVEAAGGPRQAASIGFLSLLVELVATSDPTALERLRKLVSEKRESCSRWS